MCKDFPLLRILSLDRAHLGISAKGKENTHEHLVLNTSGRSYFTDYDFLK